MRLFLLPFLKLHVTFASAVLFWLRALPSFILVLKKGNDSFVLGSESDDLLCGEREKTTLMGSTPMWGSDYLYGHHFLVDKGSASLFFATPVWESGE